MNTPKVGRSKKAKSEKELLDSINLPDYDETAHTILGDRILFVQIEPDQDASNPCEDQDGFGMIRSLSNRHINNINYDEAQTMLEEDNDVVPLSYFEHGNSLWMVANDPSPAGVEFRWDGVRFAGIWIPDDCLRDEVKGLDATARREKMREFARQACETYTEWSNGDVWGYNVQLFKIRKDDDGDPYDTLEDYRRDTPLAEDSCWGFFGRDYAIEETKTAIKYLLKEK